MPGGVSLIRRDRRGSVRGSINESEHVVIRTAREGDLMSQHAYLLYQMQLLMVLLFILKSEI